MHREPNGDRTRAIEEITRNIPKLISEEHNQMLLKLVDIQEVEHAVRQLKAGKPPGPDGFTSNFFHSFWQLIKMEVWQVVEESRSFIWMFPRVNATFIALVPKVDNPSTPDKYIPIALCNIIYKIVSKIIASWLKLLLPLIISPEKSRYVEARQIMDGIILTHEIIHSLKISKKPGVNSFWLCCSLGSMDYEPHFILFFLCPYQWHTILYLLSYSGHQVGRPPFPLSICYNGQGLGRSIRLAQQSMRIKGLSFHNSPAFTHQQFVDDNILFRHPSVQEAHQLKSLLSNFSDASRASINKSKSQIFFFHTPPSIKSTIIYILSFSSASLPSAYLGAPLIVSALKHLSWKILLEKLEARLSSWTYRSLNMASRLVLIKVVLQAMPLYLFSIQAMPKWVLKELITLQ
eukprot:PITA_23412